MLELFEYLKANGFRVFVCSGGGRDFMRVFTEGTWASSRTEGVIGSSADYEYVDGKIVRQDRMLGAPALGPGKPAHIYAHTGGRRYSPAGTPTSTCSNRRRSRC